MTVTLETEIAKLTDAEVWDLIGVLLKRVDADSAATPKSHVEYIRKELEEMQKNPDAGLTMEQFLSQRR